MAKFSEWRGWQQWTAIAGAAVVATAGLFFLVFKGQHEQNAAAQEKLRRQLQETVELESYKPRLAELERQLVTVNQQLEEARRIVPENEEADSFVRSIDAEAVRAGIEIRRYTASPWLKKTCTRRRRSRLR
jgi:Tfp pilus assembly protein PilO